MNDRRAGGRGGGGAGSVVVLGATGFVGRHICEVFGAAGWTVTGVARSVQGPPAPYDIVPLDVVDAEPGRIAALLAERGAGVVVNAAGAVWQTTEDDMTRANADLVKQLVAATARSAGRPRLIQLGSVHEYGPVPRTGITEDTPTAPVTPYGRSKLAGARALLDATEAGAAEGLVLRVSNVSGPGTHRASLLGMVAHHLATGSPEPLRLAPLLAHRDFVDVRDVADAALAAANSQASGQVLNIGGGQATSVRSLVARLTELAGAAAEIVEAPSAGGRPPEAEWQRMDIGRAGELLGWSPRRSLDDSLRDLLAHARDAVHRESLSSALQVARTTMAVSDHR
ncbi:NAD-dependent epimerase/dehydratase family protein [Streptomyces sp. NPDC001691]|uniref:NAD-dependent epimerase/dehydratase family protein n=1 Tax=Streptomyces sp. NPDC001691 TaxID=3364600 RepID=UPI000DE8E5D5|nr:NAD(P)-dependent oxidoreductase [Streptomyces sp. SDr-06]